MAQAGLNTYVCIAKDPLWQSEEDYGPLFRRIFLTTKSKLLRITKDTSYTESLSKYLFSDLAHFKHMK